VFVKRVFQEGEESPGRFNFVDKAAEGGANVRSKPGNREVPRMVLPDWRS